MGRVASVDISRLAAPVPQIAPVSPRHLETYRRRGLELVEPIVYKHGTQYSAVVGWKDAAIVDNDSGLCMVSALARGGAPEADILFETLLPTLFRLWPDCPLEALVGDSIYDNEPVCRRLVERWGIQPIFARSKREETKKTKTVKDRDGESREVSFIDGVPDCPDCGPMTAYKREGWPDVERRRQWGIPRGAMALDVKKARTRWRCRCGRFPHVELYAHHDYRDNTYYTRDPESHFGAERRAHELLRNTIESSFARVKSKGMGTRNGRKLSLRDAGMNHLLRIERLLHTARRYVHEKESGTYHFFHEEYVELGLHQSGTAPTRERMDEVASRRPPWLHLRWPRPGRASGDLQDAA
jgi:hypothetical protein